MRYLITLLLALSLTSCGTYVMQSSKPQISHVLAVTTAGDTINMPIEEFKRKVEPNYYDNWRFYYNSQWYWGNNWFYGLNDPYWRWRMYQYYYNRPNIYTPKPRVQINGRRGNSNQNIQYNTPRSNNTRSSITPRVPNNNTNLRRDNSNRKN